MLALFDWQPSGLSTLTGLLEVVDSSRSTSMQRLKAISRLEEELGKIVISESDQPGPSNQIANNAWWEAQGLPRTCIALSLLHLIHRLHLQCQPADRGKGKDMVEGDAVCGQFVGCFTILQGLCLKNKESQQICTRKGTIELLLDIIGADYWMNESLLSNAPAHALDLLICITISSPPASKLVESLQGEEVVRSLMARHTVGRGQQKGNNRKAVTLDQVQDNPLAIKCAEFLLFFEYEREEPARQKARLEVAVDESIFLNDSFRSAVNQSSHHQRRNNGEKKEKPKSNSPNKVTRETVKARREERIKPIRSRPLQSSRGYDASQQQITPIHSSSPSKSALVSMQKKPMNNTKTSLTPFAKAMSTSPLKKSRGRTRSRSPLGILHQLPVPNSQSIPTSPLKSIMGPSPAVQRAHARSLSPVKRHTDKS